MFATRALPCVIVAMLFALGTNPVGAQQVVVQQPVIGMSTVNTTVMVPDRGQILLGGRSSAQSSRQQYGAWPRGSNVGLSRSSNSFSATVTIIDLHEMDEAILNSAPSSPASGLRVQTRAAREEAHGPAAMSPQEKALHFERLAQRAEEQGRPGVAKLHWAMAAKYGSLSGLSKP